MSFKYHSRPRRPMIPALVGSEAEMLLPVI